MRPPIPRYPSPAPRTLRPHAKPKCRAQNTLPTPSFPDSSYAGVCIPRARHPPRTGTSIHIHKYRSCLPHQVVTPDHTCPIPGCTYRPASARCPSSALVCIPGATAQVWTNYALPRFPIDCPCASGRLHTWHRPAPLADSGATPAYPSRHAPLARASLHKWWPFSRVPSVHPPNHAHAHGPRRKPVRRRHGVMPRVACCAHMRCPSYDTQPTLRAPVATPMSARPTPQWCQTAVHTSARASLSPRRRLASPQIPLLAVVWNSARPLQMNPHGTQCSAVYPVLHRALRIL